MSFSMFAKNSYLIINKIRNFLKKIISKCLLPSKSYEEAQNLCTVLELSFGWCENEFYIIKKPNEADWSSYIS